MTELANAGPSKKPFLKRGEGTARRVYAFKYRDEAKKRREENQKAAMERTAIREHDDAFDAPDHCTRVDDHPATTTQTETPINQSPLRSKSEQQSPPVAQLDVEDCAFDSTSFSPLERQTEVSLVDGSCRIETQEDERDNGEHRGVQLETRGERRDAWLESQRRHEEEQWEEAMELREFESLERLIVEETRTKLEKAQDAFQKKRVTFQDIPAEDTLLPQATKTTRSHPVTRQKPKDRVQKVKSLCAKRQEKLRDVRCPSGDRVAGGDSMEKRASGRRLIPQSQSSDIQTPSPLRMESGNCDRAEKVVVDSSFLDRLIEKDFYDVCQPPEAQDLEKGFGFQEEIRLHAMREDFEREKADWQRRQETAMSQFEAMKTEEMKKIKRERRVLEQQSKAILKLPNKKERSEIESLEALLETERKESRSKEARHKLTVERLRDQIQQLQMENKEFQEEVKWYEGMQLKDGSPKKECRSVMTSPPVAFDVGTQMEANENNISLNECTSCQDNGMSDKWPMRLENPFYSETSTQESLSKTEPVSSSMYRPSRREEMGIFEQMPGWTSEPFAFTQTPTAPFTLPETSLHGMGHPLNGGNHMGGSLVTDNRYGGNPLDRDYGRGYTYGGQQMNWIQNYAHPGIFQPSNGNPLMPGHSLPNYMCQPTPPSDIAFGRGGYPGLNMEETKYNGRSGFGLDWKQGLNGHATQLPPRVAATYPTMDAVPTLLPGNCAAESPFMTSHSTNIAAPIAHQERNTPIERTPGTSQMESTLSVDTSVSAIPKPSRHQHSNTQNPPSTVITSAPFSSPRSNMLETNNKLPTRSRSVADPSVATFDNGTIKQSYADGRVVVWFGNSDVKHVHPCGRVEYLYADLSTWQVTYSNNIDVFYFDIGQVEAHKPNGDKDIIFPDGTVRTVFADGSEKDVNLEDVMEEVRRPKPEIPGNRPERRFRKRLPGKK